MFGRFVRRSRLAWLWLTLCAGISGAVLAGTAGTASAHAGGYTTLDAASSGLVLDVDGASTDPGAPVIQWPVNGGSNQYWNVPGTGYTGVIQNLNSGMCLSTDGVAGDQLYQWPCDPSLAVYQRWNVSTGDDPGVGVVDILYNPAFGLAVDVYGNSGDAGAPIDAWPLTGQANQLFLPLSFGGGV